MAGRQGVRRGDHSSGTPVAGRLKQPTRTTRPTDGPAKEANLFRASFLFGFAPGGACHAADVAAGAVRSYRTLSPLPRLCRAKAEGGLLSVALSLGSPPPGVTRRLVPWSPDFPLLGSSGRPADWSAGLTGTRLGGQETAPASSINRRVPLSMASFIGSANSSRGSPLGSPAKIRSPPSRASAGSRAAPRIRRC